MWAEGPYEAVESALVRDGVRIDLGATVLTALRVLTAVAIEDVTESDFLENSRGTSLSLVRADRRCVW